MVNFKKLLAAGLLMMMAQLMVAQVSNPFFDKLKGAKGAEVMEFGEELMAVLARMSVESPEEKALMQHIKSMKVLNLDSANTPAVLKTAREEADKIEKAGMTKLVSEQKEAEEVSVYVLKKDNVIQEFFMWGYDNEDGFFAVQMNGTFTEDELGGLMNMGK
ncbi:MAG: DUF4252 domain-containing protein [Bacteroidaceae bacterium]|nr:DUF4252 domain-containing protein [Bacteroidaceae bacterium]